MRRKPGMKKVKSLKGFVIADTNGNSSYKFHVYSKEDWSMGEGYRWAEWECDNLQEAIDFITYY